MQTLIDIADNTSIKINDMSDLAKPSGTREACLELRATVVDISDRVHTILYVHVCAVEGWGTYPVWIFNIHTTRTYTELCLLHSVAMAQT